MNNQYEKPSASGTDFNSSTTPDNDEVISTLNGLIETCKDGQDGFKVAAEGVERSPFRVTPLNRSSIYSRKIPTVETGSIRR